MPKKLVENYKNTLKISDLRDYGLLRKFKTVTSGIIPMFESPIGVILEKYDTEGYLKVFVNKQNIIFNKLNTDDYGYVIHLGVTKCNYGGFRWWFICPGNGKKCSILYLMPDGKFYSRKYLNLSYREQNLSKNQRDFEEYLGKNDEKYYKLKSSIKYPIRNGLKTRKQKRIEYLEEKLFDIDKIKCIGEKRLGNINSRF